MTRLTRSTPSNSFTISSSMSLLTDDRLEITVPASSPVWLDTDESESFSDLCLEQHLEQHLTYIERQHTKIITIKPIHPATIAPISDGEQQKLNKQDDSEPE